MSGLQRPGWRKMSLDELREELRIHTHLLREESRGEDLDIETMERRQELIAKLLRYIEERQA